MEDLTFDFDLPKYVKSKWDLELDEYLSKGENSIIQFLQKSFFPQTFKAICLSTNIDEYFCNYYLNKLKDIGLIKENRIYNPNKILFELKYEFIHKLDNTIFGFIKRTKNLTFTFYHRIFEFLINCLLMRYLKPFDIISEIKTNIDTIHGSNLEIQLKNEIPNFPFEDIYVSRDFKYNFKVSFDYTIKKFTFTYLKFNINSTVEKNIISLSNTNDLPTIDIDSSKKDIIHYMNKIGMNVKPFNKNKDPKNILLNQLKEFINQKN